MKTVIVTFRPKTERRADLDKVDVVRHASPAARVLADANFFGAPILVLATDEAGAERLREDPGVLRVETDGPVSITPPPPVWQAPARTASLPPNVDAWWLRHIGAAEAQRVTTGLGVRVGTLDTGIDWTHTAIQSQYVAGASFIPDQPSAMDDHNHGTHVGHTVLQVAPDVSLFAGKVLAADGQGLWSWVVAGLAAAIDARMDVVNMSLGGTEAPVALEDLCREAQRRGVLVVASAGNAGGPVGAPASYPSVLAVSATDAHRILPSWSNRGPEIELAAPGVGIMAAQRGNPMGYIEMSGTSMAAPLVTGAAALAFSAHRGNRLEEIRALLKHTATDLYGPGPDPETGAGLVDAARATTFFRRQIPGLPL